MLKMSNTEFLKALDLYDPEGDERIAVLTRESIDLVARLKKKK